MVSAAPDKATFTSPEIFKHSMFEAYLDPTLLSRRNRKTPISSRNWHGQPLRQSYTISQRQNSPEFPCIDKDLPTVPPVTLDGRVADSNLVIAKFMMDSCGQVWDFIQSQTLMSVPQMSSASLKRFEDRLLDLAKADISTAHHQQNDLLSKAKQSAVIRTGTKDSRACIKQLKALLGDSTNQKKSVAKVKAMQQYLEQKTEAVNKNGNQRIPLNRKTNESVTRVIDQEPSANGDHPIQPQETRKSDHQANNNGKLEGDFEVKTPSIQITNNDLQIFALAQTIRQPKTYFMNNLMVLSDYINSESLKIEMKRLSLLHNISFNKILVSFCIEKLIEIFYREHDITMRIDEKYVFRVMGENVLRLLKSVTISNWFVLRRVVRGALNRFGALSLYHDSWLENCLTVKQKLRKSRGCSITDIMATRQYFIRKRGSVEKEFIKEEPESADYKDYYKLMPRLGLKWPDIQQMQDPEKQGVSSRLDYFQKKLQAKRINEDPKAKDNQHLSRYSFDGPVKDTILDIEIRIFPETPPKEFNKKDQRDTPVSKLQKLRSKIEQRICNEYLLSSHNSGTNKREQLRDSDLEPLGLKPNCDSSEQLIIASQNNEIVVSSSGEAEDENCGKPPKTLKTEQIIRKLTQDEEECKKLSTRLKKNNEPSISLAQGKDQIPCSEQAVAAMESLLTQHLEEQRDLSLTMLKKEFNKVLASQGVPAYNFTLTWKKWMQQIGQ